MKKNEKGSTINYQIDLSTSKIVATNTEKNDWYVDDLHSKLTQSLTNVFDSTAKWVEEFNDLIALNKHHEAFDLLIKNQGKLKYIKKEIGSSLLGLDKQKLNSEQRKEYYILLIFVFYKETNIGAIENEINNFLLEFENNLESDLLQSLLLSKADAAALNNKVNVASNIYLKLIDDNDTDGMDKACSYRGLAKIATFEADTVLYTEKAIDKFLEVGSKKEAIGDLVFLSEIYAKKDPDKSLNFIDKAISLYDSEAILNKQYIADLYYRKAYYLFSLKKYTKALEQINISCELVENLIINEYDRYSYNSLALLIVESLNLDEKVTFLKEKLELISSRINSDEFILHIKLIKCINQKKEVPAQLIEEIEKSTFNNLKLVLYIHNAENEKYSFWGKIEWMDKAIQLLNKDEFQDQHYCLVYFNLGEVYRKENKTDQAILNYEKSLEYNPFYKSAIQNCGAVLWQAKKWKKSKEFFKLQINRLGDSPTLNYAYGRSLFECNEIQEAFIYFRKALRGNVQGVDINNYISLCLQSDASLNLVVESDFIQTEAISLDSFKSTLDDFATSISTNSRMHFWKNESGNHKWKPSPEELGKQFLVTALGVKYGTSGIEITQEKLAGAGIIDLFITLRGGLKIVVELKVCGGNGYSSTYALSGEDQLIHYLKNTQTNIAFLVVFDGRRKDFGVGLKAISSYGNATIFTVAIDLNPKIK